jgi:hypothetical protein
MSFNDVANDVNEAPNEGIIYIFFGIHGIIALILNSDASPISMILYAISTVS